MRSVLTAGVLLVAAALVPAAARAAEPAPVSFYECLPCSTSPTIDGVLDDACWQPLPLLDGFYLYWTPVAKPPPLRTSARLCYDAAGLYLGITLFEEHLDRIRATVSGRDDPEMWKDDCVEIMIDPAGQGTGYDKFTTNFLGARYDEKTVNMVNDASYSVEGWRVKTARGGDAWTIECFIPWSDLEHRPASGDIWSFNLVRYGYSSGGFKGVSWSLGGSYAAPGKFGHIGFGSFAPYSDAALARLASALRRTKGDYFRLLVPGLVLTYDHGRWQREEMRHWLRTALRTADAELDEARAACAAAAAVPGGAALKEPLVALTGSVADLRAAARADVAPAAAVVAYEQSRVLRRDLRDLRYRALLLTLVDAQL